MSCLLQNRFALPHIGALLLGCCLLLAARPSEARISARVQQRAAQAKVLQKKWLSLAPKPGALEPGQQYHVFLSYRRTQRAAATEIFEALTTAGYKVFMDLHTQVPGEHVMHTLDKAITKSASGLMLWSGDSKDSAWVKAEYRKMRERQKSSNFKLVVAKVSAEAKVPRVFRDEFVDFSPTGGEARGEALLKIFQGVSGNRPSPEAARLSAKVAEERQVSAAKIRGAEALGDSKQLVKLTKSEGDAWLTSPALSTMAAEALIGLGETASARKILNETATVFPKAIRPKQLQALALVRDGKLEKGQAVLGELHALGLRDAETMGIFARSWFDRYQTTKQKKHLRRSRDLYAEAFELNPTSYYTGINAATKSVFLGEKDKGRAIARELIKQVGTDLSPGDYWKTATAAETQLVLGNTSKAAALYQAAIATASESLASHQSTRGQALRLADALKLSAAERAQIEAAFEE